MNCRIVVWRNIHTAKVTYLGQTQVVHVIFILWTESGMPDVCRNVYSDLIRVYVDEPRLNRAAN